MGNALTGWTLRQFLAARLIATLADMGTAFATGANGWLAAAEPIAAPGTIISTACAGGSVHALAYSLISVIPG